MLLFPQTFMNRSGEAVRASADYYNIDPEDILVIHDDIDLPLGRIKVVGGSGSGGHKGVQSIIVHLKTKDFVRFRIGIDTGFQKNTEDFVLKKFTAKEKQSLKEVIEKTCQALETALKKGLNKVMNEFN